MKKVADLQDLLQRAGTTAKALPGAVSSGVMNWYNRMDPEARKAIIRGLIGAGVGGAATAGMAAATPKDPEERRHVIGPALLGMLMGGTAAAGLPYGLKMLAGDAKMPGMSDRKPVISSAVDTVLSPAVHNPFTTAGLGAGLWGLYGKRTGTDGNSARNIDAALKYINETPGAASALGGTKAKLLQNVKNYLRTIPRALNVHETPGLPAAKALYGIPVGLAVGALLDKYLKGEY